MAKAGPDGKTRRTKSTELMAVTDSAALPIAMPFESASPQSIPQEYEVRLVGRMLKSGFTNQIPRKFICARAYDGNHLDEKLRRPSLELFAPHKINRRKANTQDGRPMRRHQNRWKIERLFAGCKTFEGERLSINESLKTISVLPC
jgi:hypothetical protein